MKEETLKKIINNTEFDTDTEKDELIEYLEKLIEKSNMYDRLCN